MRFSGALPTSAPSDATHLIEKYRGDATHSWAAVINNLRRGVRRRRVTTSFTPVPLAAVANTGSW